MYKKNPCVYIMTNKTNGVLYTGVTSNLKQRVYQHNNNLLKGFTQKYNLHILVYYEQCESMSRAIEEEKKMKAGSRAKKIQRIESMNSEWKDLYVEL